MVKIKVLLENNSIDTQCKSSHGLSIFIEYNGKNILLDVGGDNNFSKNAKVMNIDLAKVDILFLSHNHDDHTGGINKFLEINNTSRVYLMDNIDNKYYIEFLFFKIPIGLKLDNKYRSRITQINDDLKLDNSIYFFRNIETKFKKPTFIKNYSKRIVAR